MDELESISFNLSTSGTATDLIKVSSTTTATFINLNLKQLLGILFYKYEKFSLCCSGVYSRTVGISTSYNGLSEIEMTGLPFINNSDTSVAVPSDTCVVAVMWCSFNTTPQFSNANGVTFLRPSNEFSNIIIKPVNSDGYSTFNSIDPPNLMFKITGIPNVEQIVYRPIATRECCKFVLNTALASTGYNKNTLNRFNYVDFKAILGKMYDRYNRFYLVTNQITMLWNNANGLSYTYSSDNNGCAIYMSGLDFVNTFKYPTAYQYVPTAGTSSSPASLYYRKQPVLVGMYNNQYNSSTVINGNIQILTINQNIVNIFEKTNGCEIVLINSFKGTDDLQMSANATTAEFPDFICDFSVYGIN